MKVDNKHSEHFYFDILNFNIDEYFFSDRKGKECIEFHVTQLNYEFVWVFSV